MKMIEGRKKSWIVSKKLLHVLPSSKNVTLIHTTHSLTHSMKKLPNIEQIAKKSSLEDAAEMK